MTETEMITATLSSVKDWGSAACGECHRFESSGSVLSAFAAICPCERVADSNWTWFITEGGTEGDDFLFFGYVIGHEEEWATQHFPISKVSAAPGD